MGKLMHFIGNVGRRISERRRIKKNLKAFLSNPDKLLEDRINPAVHYRCNALIPKTPASQISQLLRRENKKTSRAMQFLSSPSPLNGLALSLGVLATYPYNSALLTSAVGLAGFSYLSGRENSKKLVFALSALGGIAGSIFGGIFSSLLVASTTALGGLIPLYLHEKLREKHFSLIKMEKKLGGRKFL